jgi:hypothetical protein
MGKGVKILIIISWLLLFIISATMCGPSAPRNFYSARKEATRKLERILSLDFIDIRLLNGPTLIKENPENFIFQWSLKVLRSGATIFEVAVPKDPRGKTGLMIKGERRSYSYLVGTLDFPINEAVLYNLFSLPPDPHDKISDRAKRLRMIPLDIDQLEDVANFVQIKNDLGEYYFCFNHIYPDSLEELNLIIPKGDCGVFKLDSLYIHDRFGAKYNYDNLGNFVILGSMGEKGKWDFDKAIIDSIYNDQKEHIFINGDEIIVKFKPVT